jgi:hypothetical protein
MNNEYPEIFLEVGEGFYFWDENGADSYGPYNTYDECKEALLRYIKKLQEEDL